MRSSSTLAGDEINNGIRAYQVAFAAAAWSAPHAVFVDVTIIILAVPIATTLGAQR